MTLKMEYKDLGFIIYLIVSLTVGYIVFFYLFPKLWFVGASIAVIYAGYRLYKDETKPKKREFEHLFGEDVHCTKYAEKLWKEIEEKVESQMQHYSRKDLNLQGFENEKKLKKERSHRYRFNVTKESSEFMKAAKAAALDRGFCIEELPDCGVDQE